MGKPMTDQMFARANTLWLYMKKHPEPLTKAQICDICCVGSERQARDIISVLAQHQPIISTSDSTGYRLAMTADDLREVEHTWAELSSRMEELEKRIKPLIRFRDKYKEIKND